MENNLFFILASICLFTHICRTIYEIMKHKNLLRPGKLSFVIMFTNMLLLWVSWFLLCKNDISRINIPELIKYSGLIITGLGIVAFLMGLLTIKTLESYDGDLITSGIYSIFRHPMYVGFILWLIGFPLYFGAMYSLILSVLFISDRKSVV
jgi:protein-S-isoprenylcysteine O-methyltransferase Ste14